MWLLALSERDTPPPNLVDGRVNQQLEDEGGEDATDLGAAIRFITSEPAPIPHMMGNPTQVVTKVMNFGRNRLAAP